MQVTELNQEQLEELRSNYFAQLQDIDKETLGGITQAEEIPISNIIAHYAGISFVNDYFFCSMEDNSEIF